MKRLLSHWSVVVSSHDPLPNKNNQQPVEGVAGGSVRARPVPEAGVWVGIPTILKRATY